MIAAREENRRILIVDDNEAIHDDYRKVLAGAKGSTANDEDELDLFGEQSAPPMWRDSFELDSAYQGQQGFRQVDAALRAGRPYALAFVDMRMPPGWDGLETIERIRQIDTRLQIVICTAYSDHTWHEIVARVARQDSLMILKKPFESIEVKQLAHALTKKWQLSVEAEMTAEEMERRIQAQTEEIRLTRDLAFEALQSLSSAWLQRDKETLGRFMSRLRRRHQFQAEKYEKNSELNRRRAPRTPYEAEITVFIPNRKGRDEPLFKVLSRDVSGSGISFVYHSDIVTPEIVLLLELGSRKPTLCHGRIVRKVQISESLWEFGVEFTKKSLAGCGVE